MKHPSSAKHQGSSGSAAEAGLGSVPGLLKSSAIGAGCGLLFSLLLALIGAVICICSSDPHALIVPVGLIALYFSALLGGWIAIRHHKSAPLPCGVICGAMMLLLFLLVSLFFDKTKSNGFSFGISLLLRALLPFFSLLGARMGMKRRNGSRRAKRKNK